MTQVLSSTIHTTLDEICIVPVFGEGADGVNSLFYMAEGDYQNAGFSAGAMIPFIGWGSTATKWSCKALKYSDNAFHSFSGLIFKKGSKHGNRLSHVLAHTVYDLNKPKHGVFTLGDDLIKTIDDAWNLAKKEGKMYKNN